jgi:uncharacterized repeat protein (TIGR03803 family)
MPMPTNKSLTVPLGVLALISGVFLIVPAYATGGYELLQSFGGTRGDNPAGVILDAAGNLYGTAIDSAGGIVFELTKGANGKWSETIIYQFADSIEPNGGLVFDATGNLYGTVSLGPSNYGKVFQLSPGTNGPWTEMAIYTFRSPSDGDGPSGRLIFDSSGNLYGTTQSGGANGGGVVFELEPGSNGKWNKKTLHNFASNAQDGITPMAGLTLDSEGHLYGTTLRGGNHSGSCNPSGCGTVFELEPGANGRWTETVLHRFNSKSGAVPYADLTLDASGNLYGTTFDGGDFGYGTVFRLTPGTNNQWTETVLHNFNANEKDGIKPMTGVILDGAGNLYGTTYEGGAYSSACGGPGCGTIFELTPVAKGDWDIKILLNFDGHDGATPEFVDLCFDADGGLFGATPGGGYLYGIDCNGLDGCGVAFEIAP